MPYKTKPGLLYQIVRLFGAHSKKASPQSLVTYKYLDLGPDMRFSSPIAKTVWDNLESSGTGEKECDKRDWIWSCLTPSNPILQDYYSDIAVLVTLQVWGKIVMRDNGVVQSQHAKIIGYDVDDYYYALLRHGKVDFHIACEMISKDGKRYLELAVNYADRLPIEELTEILRKKRDPDLAVQIGQKRDFEEARRIACLTPEGAYNYALHVDKGARDDTRSATCKEPVKGFEYAYFIEKVPHPETRRVSCLNPYLAYQYARFIDRCPRDDTREVVCLVPQLAYEYALYVDKCPRDDTRCAASQDPDYAYQYAVYVDHEPTRETWQGVQKSSKHRKDYLSWAKITNPDWG